MAQVQTQSRRDAADAAIVLEGVHKSFGTFQALTDVSLTVRRGERIVVGVVLGVGFQLFTQIVLDLGLVAGFNAPLTALAPIAVSLAVGVVLFRRATGPR